MEQCARCDESAGGIYEYQLPQGTAFTEPLCRSCARQLRSAIIAEIEKVRDIGERKNGERKKV